MPLSSFSFGSSLHMTKNNNNTTTPLKNRSSSNLTKSNNSMAIPTNIMISNDPSNSAGPSSSRSASLAGRKRPREFIENGGGGGENGKNRTPSRRTKSTGDARDSNSRNNNSNSQSSKDREAFQRGLISVFVPKALQESKQGNLSHYNDLLSHFLPTPTSPIPSLPPLLPLLKAISAHVSLLSPEIHSPLVTAIINLPWATGDEKFVKAFIGWAAVLVSAQPGWAKEVVGMAVKGLTWQPPFISPNTAPISRRIFHARHHLLLSHLISLVPTLPNVLQPLLIRNFPHKREETIAQTTWIRNCCELIGYCPELGGRMWGEIVDRMLRIDVEITNSIEDDDDEDSDAESDDEGDLPINNYAQFNTNTIDPLDLLISQQLPRPRTSSPSPDIGFDDDASDGDPDPDELSSDDGDDSDDEEDSKNKAKLDELKAKKKANVKSMREKLDGMLVYFFDHLEEYMGAKSSHLPAIEMAAQNIQNNISGNSTPTSEYPPTLQLQLQLNSNSIISSIHKKQKSPITPAQSLSYFQTLLNLFSRQILPTSSTQHIPFLLFLTSSFSPSHTDLFLGLLVSQALYGQSTSNHSTNNTQLLSMNQRISATVYIGSIVCRARFVNDDQAKTVLTYLLAYIDGKLHQSRINGNKGIDELPLFYSVCQSVMLIFCFRWRAFTNSAIASSNQQNEDIMVGDLELEDMDDDDNDNNDNENGNDNKWISDLDILQRAITSELNPLLGCNPTIVSTFAKVSHQTNFLYCFSIIEANQQSSHPPPTRSLSNQNLKNNNTIVQQPSSEQSKLKTITRTNSSIIGSQTLPRQARQTNIESGLDSYFPFDPYDLPKSKKFIERLYRTWSEVSIKNGNDNDSDSDSDDSSDSEAEEGVENGDGDGDDDSIGSSLEDHMKIHKSLPLNIKVGSYGEHRRNKLLDHNSHNNNNRDNGLSSSLEGMSISPNNFGVGVLGN
ncbi:uncharacterized protein L201_003436 [Kwoniella dendrophila CBS 6074]|uniref:RNA polymerase I-specific transcription initiation factor RRN3 n=1 Tax=Kwoniella dendrophila CBS 6074 TaxID=1295534 RepID=A0AAX4JT10_9TREE